MNSHKCPYISTNFHILIFVKSLWRHFEHRPGPAQRRPRFHHQHGVPGCAYRSHDRRHSEHGSVCPAPDMTWLTDSCIFLQLRSRFLAGFLFPIVSDSFKISKTSEVILPFRVAVRIDKSTVYGRKGVPCFSLHIASIAGSWRKLADWTKRHLDCLEKLGKQHLQLLWLQ